MSDILVNYDTHSAVRWDDAANDYVPTEVLFNDKGDEARVWNGSDYVAHFPPPKEEEVKESYNVVRAFADGLKSSVSGMIYSGKPYEMTPAEMTYTQMFANQTGTLLGDFPFMVVGAKAGAAIGGAAGLPTGVGAVGTAAVAAGAGALALPRTMRKVLIDEYRRGRMTAGEALVDSVMSLPSVLLEMGRGVAEGAVVASSGIVGRAAAEAGASAIARSAAPQTIKNIAQSSATPLVVENVAQTIAAGTYAAALDGQLPTAQDFIVGTVTGVAVGGAMEIAGRRALERSFVEDGVDPRVNKQAAESDPAVLSELLSITKVTPDETKPMGTDIALVRAADDMGGKSEAPATGTDLVPLEGGGVGQPPELPPKGTGKGGAGGDVEPPNNLAAVKLSEWSKLMRDLVDHLAPLKGLVPEYTPSIDPYISRSLLRGQTAARQTYAFFKGEVFDTEGKKLRNVAPLKDLFDTKLFSDAERVQTAELAMKARLVEVAVKRPEMLPDGFDMDAAIKEVAAAPKKIKDGIQTLHDNAKASIEILKDNGGKYALLSGAEADNIQALNELYVPFKGADVKQFDYMRRGLTSKGMQAFIGAADVIDDPIQQLSYALLSAPQRVLTNKSNVLLVEALAAQKKANRVPKYKMTGDVKANQIDVWVYGERQRWEIPEVYMKTIEWGVDKSDWNMAHKIAAKASKMSKLGIASMPEFLVNVLVLDQAASALTTKGYVPFVDMFRGLFATVRETDAAKQAKLAGAIETAFSKRMLPNKNHLYDKLGRYIGDLVEYDRQPVNVIEGGKLEVFSDALSETFTRLASGSRERGWELRMEQARKSFPDMSEADRRAMVAMDVKKMTLDTQRIGAQMVGLNSIKKFLNATIQAPIQTVELLRKTPHEHLAMMAGLTITSQAALWVANKLMGDAEFSPEDRDRYYIFNADGVVHRVRKPPVFGALANMTETTLDVLFDNGVITIDSVLADLGLDNMGSKIVSAAVPDIVLPLAEVGRNYNYYFGSTIVPKWLEKELGEYQFLPSTTVVAKKLAAASNYAISAIKVDHIMQGYFGGSLMKTLDVALKGATGVDIAFDDLPLVRAFSRKYPETRLGAAFQYRDYYAKEVADLRTAYKKSAERGAVVSEIALGTTKPSDSSVRFAASVEALFNDPVFVQAAEELKAYASEVDDIARIVRKIQALPEGEVVNKDRLEAAFLGAHKFDVGNATKEQYVDSILLLLDHNIKIADNARKVLATKKKEYGL